MFVTPEPRAAPISHPLQREGMVGTGTRLARHDSLGCRTHVRSFGFGRRFRIAGVAKGSIKTVNRELVRYLALGEVELLFDFLLASSGTSGSC